ncbi:hypothetical protein AB6E89_01315 [Vibrio breoganii]
MKKLRLVPVLISVLGAFHVSANELKIDVIATSHDSASTIGHLTDGNIEGCVYDSKSDKHDEITYMNIENNEVVLNIQTPIGFFDESLPTTAVISGGDGARHEPITIDLTASNDGRYGADSGTQPEVAKLRGLLFAKKALVDQPTVSVRQGMKSTQLEWHLDESIMYSYNKCEESVVLANMGDGK